jgi:uncharacterized membrane protein YvlD (DUF360 family)
MRAWLIRFVCLYVFDVVVLLVIDLLTPAVSVGWAVIFGALVLALVTLFIKPLVTRIFRGIAAKSVGNRTKLGERLVQYLIVLAVSAIVWVITVVFTGVHVSGWFWGWIAPPVLLLIAWAIYDVVDESLEKRATALYVKAMGGPAAGNSDKDAA